MAKLAPDLDKFTKNLNKTVPSITGGLSDKVRKANTTSAIDGVKDEICDKIGGVVNLASGIISGAIGVFNDAKAILTGENNLSDAIGGAVDSFFEDAKDKINKIKQREWGRPFGASVTEEGADMFFDIPVSRHMLFNSRVLYCGIPGVTHVDGTCGHQTVPDDDTPFRWLLHYVEEELGLPIVLNTSLNKKR